MTRCVCGAGACARRRRDNAVSTVRWTMTIASATASARRRANLIEASLNEAGNDEKSKEKEKATSPWPFFVTKFSVEMPSEARLRAPISRALRWAKDGGVDGTRTRGLCRDRAAF